MTPSEFRPINKVLVADRGEIAVRIIRAARDTGIKTVAAFSEPDSNALFVQLADEAISIGGSELPDSYLNVDQVLDAGIRSDVDAVHAGYGLLSENTDFAQAVIDAGLIWIGPSPSIIRTLGDKFSATRVNAPLGSVTSEPLTRSHEAIEFAQEHGLPVALKPAFEGGGRGMRIAHSVEDIPQCFESAVIDAHAAFGDSECVAERYLERARHVEVQLLADQYGRVVVVGTRDCTLQHRFQKLIEEAPAPFLTNEQRDRICNSSKAILLESGYCGACTVEFLVSKDGLLSFLGIKTRLTAEHTVTEQTTGIDLIRQQFNIAMGKTLDISDRVEPHGHSIEFRINAEDPAQEFLPKPGNIVKFCAPSGPGVRLDAGVVQGDAVNAEFDSTMAKLVVTGSNRQQALARARRALDEFEIEGLITTLPFHRDVVSHPLFRGDGEAFDVHTRWIEEDWESAIACIPARTLNDESMVMFKTAIEVDKRRMELSVPSSLLKELVERLTPLTRGKNRQKPKPVARKSALATMTPDDDSVFSPMQGTVARVPVSEGQSVERGDLVLVIEAMKMENPVNAHKAGVISDLNLNAGDSIARSALLMKIN